MMRRPPRSTRVRSSAASDVYKRQNVLSHKGGALWHTQYPNHWISRNVFGLSTFDDGNKLISRSFNTVINTNCPWLLFAGGGPGFLKMAINRNLMNRIKSVSYTHLRAHETVLDLVCRLLLE